MWVASISPLEWTKLSCLVASAVLAGGFGLAIIFKIALDDGDDPDAPGYGVGFVAVCLLVLASLLFAFAALESQEYEDNSAAVSMVVRS